jgi:hypothetical protein
MEHHLEEAFKKLGYVSPAQLREAIAHGTLRLGKEVQDRRNPNAVYIRISSINTCSDRLSVESSLLNICY